MAKYLKPSALVPVFTGINKLLYNGEYISITIVNKIFRENGLSTKISKYLFRVVVREYGLSKSRKASELGIEGFHGKPGIGGSGNFSNDEIEVLLRKAYELKKSEKRPSSKDGVKAITLDELSLSEIKLQIAQIKERLGASRILIEF